MINCSKLSQFLNLNDLLLFVVYHTDFVQVIFDIQFIVHYLSAGVDHISHFHVLNYFVFI